MTYAYRCAVAALTILLACDRDHEQTQEDDPEDTPTCESARTGEQIAIKPELHCDGTPDCANEEDEQDCPDSFECRDGRPPYKVPLHKVCDGVLDCERGADEADCPDSGRTLCSADDEASPWLYTVAQHCDGVAQCFYAEDEKGCPESQLCPTYDVGGGQRAIPRSKVCDGAWDCTIDEYDCPGASDPFTCPDGKKIDRKFVCDQATDCKGFNAADETDPSCHQFECERGYSDFAVRAPCKSCAPWFIADTRVCDGVRDCEKGDDELKCPEPFACAGGLFLRATKRCDGKPDCPQGDDEVSCP